MADVTYQVLVEYMTSGNLHSDLSGASHHASHLGGLLSEASSAASEIGSELVHGFQHAVEHAGHLAMHLAKIGGAAGVGAIAYGIGHLNAELEQTQISLGAIFKGQGFAKDFNEGFEIAGEQVKKMRQDIKTLPGDLGQLSNVMMQIASPLANAGKDPDAIRKFAGQTMLASSIMLGGKYGSQAQEIGAREMTQLLHGQFSSRNSWAQDLPGLDKFKDQWKKMTEGQRLDIIQKQMDNLTQGSAERFGKSWAAVWTTFKDNIKYVMVAGATLPLFERAKKSLNEINDWFDRHGPRAAQELGDHLASAWDRLDKVVHEWWPTVINFAKQMGHELSVIWEKFAPAITEVSDALKGALGDGSVMKDIGKVLELYAMTKVAGGPAAGAGVNHAVGTAAGALLGPGGAAAGGVLGDITGNFNLEALLGKAFDVGLVGAIKDKPKETAEAMTKLAAATQKLVDLFDAQVMPSLENFSIAIINIAANDLTALVEIIKAIEHPLDTFRDKMDSIGYGVSTFGDAMKGVVKFLKDHKLIAGEAMAAEDPATVERGNSELHFLRTMGNTITSQNEEAKKAGQRAKHPGGLGMHVQKVEIVVNQNQDPGRVAEAVMTKMQNVRLHPKVSPLAANYSVR